MDHKPYKTRNQGNTRGRAHDHLDYDEYEDDWVGTPKKEKIPKRKGFNHKSW